MLISHKQSKETHVNQPLTPNEKGEWPEYVRYLKPDTIEILMKVCNVSNDNQLADRLGVCRQLICRLKKRKTPATEFFMSRVAMITGNMGSQGNFGAHFYEPVFTGRWLKTNHQKHNYRKFYKEMPYEQHSQAAHDRRGDGEIIEERKS